MRKASAERMRGKETEGSPMKGKESEGMESSDNTSLHSRRGSVRRK